MLCIPIGPGSGLGVSCLKSHTPPVITPTTGNQQDITSNWERLRRFEVSIGFVDSVDFVGIGELVEFMKLKWLVWHF